MKVFFYVQPTERLGYQHNAISLAQGFRQLGIPYDSSATYWREPDGGHLFTAHPDPDLNDYDLLIVTEQYQTYGDGSIPEAFFKAKGRKLFITTADGIILHRSIHHPYFKRFDDVLAFRYKGLPYPDRIHAWAFGMSQHMIDFGLPNLPKGPQICLNYRNAHSVRKISKEILFDKLQPGQLDTTIEKHDWQALRDSLDYEEYMEYQSAGRHNKSYRERIAGSSATSAFGGHFFLRPWIWSSFNFGLVNYFVDSAAASGRANNLMRKIGLQYKHTYRVYQWDSWRFWEAFAGASMAINVDFEKYRIELPVMPENFKHYLGVDLKKPKPALELLDSPQRMQEIGRAGREWAIEHYSPKAQAIRLLGYLKMKQ